MSREFVFIRSYINIYITYQNSNKSLLSCLFFKHVSPESLFIRLVKNATENEAIFAITYGEKFRIMGLETNCFQLVCWIHGAHERYGDFDKHCELLYGHHTEHTVIAHKDIAKSVANCEHGDTLVGMYPFETVHHLGFEASW